MSLLIAIASRLGTSVSCVVAFFVVLTANAFAQNAQLPPKEDFHLFLLVGQSNMAGRGEVAEQDMKPHSRVLMLDKSGKWVPAIDPMHFDKSAAGVGLGKTFGQLVANANPKLAVGLIPCAVGGSPIDVWSPGEFYAQTKSHPWDDSMERAAIALKSGKLAGIVGEIGGVCLPTPSAQLASPLFGSQKARSFRSTRIFFKEVALGCRTFASAHLE